MHCTNCGHELPEGAAFCSNCGAAVNRPQPEANDWQQTQGDQGDQGDQGYSYDQGASYDQGPYQAQPEPEPEPKRPPNDTKAIVSLCCGVLSIITMFTGAGALIGIVAAIVGLIFGIKARKENRSTMATVGIVLSAISLLLCVVVLIGCMACIGGGVALSGPGELADSIQSLINT